MARIVKAKHFKYPKKSFELLSNTEGMTSKQALNYLKKNKAPILTTWKDMGKIVYPITKKYNKYGIKISKQTTINEHPKADALYLRHRVKTPKGIKSSAEIILHPTLRYYPKPYVKQVILHETDHLDADIRNKRYKSTK
jgi:hypothetical protein